MNNDENDINLDNEGPKASAAEDGFDLLRTLQNQLSSGEKSNHLAAWAALQRADALDAIAEAWVADESRVSGMLSVIEMLPGHATRARTLRGAIRRIVVDKRKARLDKAIGVVNDNSLVTVSMALGPAAPPPQLAEPNVLDSLRIPRGYIMDASGVFKLSVATDGGTNSARIATAPVFIIGRTHDVLTGGAKRLLMWRTPAGWTMRAIDRGVLLNSQKLIGLADLEVPVTSNSAANLVEWLGEFEAENMHRLIAHQAAHRMGWIKQGDVNGFLLPEIFYAMESMEEGGVELVPPEGMEQVLEGWRPAGTWEAWCETMELMAPYTPMWLALYASAAAPLLELFNTPSFIMDFNGETSSGKTTALRVAASVWGKPADSAPTAMYSWDSTKTYIERLSGFLCNLPVILDETKRAKDTKVVRDVVYDFANGQGRGRGSIGGARQTASWRTVMLISGESSAVSFSQDGGTRARVLPVTGKPMGSGVADSGKAAEDLTHRLQIDYGHLGRRVIHYLISIAEQHDELRRIWKQTRDQYAQIARTPVTRRHAGNLATLHVASTIVHELGVPFPDEDPMAFAIDAIYRIEADQDRPLAALIEVVSWCAANQGRFWGRHETTHGGAPIVPVKGWAGAWTRGEDWDYIALLPTTLREILEPIGYHAEEIIDRWSERGWLLGSVRKQQARNSSVKSKSEVIRVHGAPMRVYRISRAVVDEQVAEDEMEIPHGN